MSGNTENASVWADADVYVSWNLDDVLPASADDDMGGSWELVGLLDGTAGFAETRAFETKDHYAWGGILVATTRKNFKLTRTFTALEDNEFTRRLAWPGSTDSELVVPHPERVKIAFETRKGGKVRRLMCANYAEVEIPSQTTNEEDLESLPFTVTVYPDSDGVLFARQSVPDIASIAITALTLALDLSDGQIKKLVATATYTDSSTGDVTNEVRWITSNAAKATVHDGYVTPVGTGTANISCTLAGVTSAAPCVVTVSA